MVDAVAPLTASTSQDGATGEDPFRVTRTVAQHGTVGVAGAQYNIGRRFARQKVTVVREGEMFRFYLGDVLLRTHQRGAPRTYVGGAVKKEVMWRDRPSHEAVS